MFGYDIPFVPSSVQRVSTMIELADIKPGQKAVDLGAGDGRIVIEMAKRGAIAVGYEIDKQRAKLSLENIKKENLEDKAIVFNGNFWYVDLSRFDIVTLYGITGIMERLEKKLKTELKEGARIVSNFFTFPGLTPEIEKEDVYLYTITNHDFSSQNQPKLF